jgi:hypothetical protein
LKPNLKYKLIACAKTLFDWSHNLFAPIFFKNSLAANQSYYQSVFPDVARAKKM